MTQIVLVGYDSFGCEVSSLGGFNRDLFHAYQFPRSVNGRVEELFTIDVGSGVFSFTQYHSDLSNFSFGSPSVEARGEINADSENNSTGIRTSRGRLP